MRGYRWLTLGSRTRLILFFILASKLDQATVKWQEAWPLICNPPTVTSFHPNRDRVRYTRVVDSSAVDEGGDEGSSGHPSVSDRLGMSKDGRLDKVLVTMVRKGRVGMREDWSDQDAVL